MNVPFSAILFALAMLLFISCNPVKRVLNDPAKTQQVVDKYLQDYHQTGGGDTIKSLSLGSLSIDSTITLDTLRLPWDMGKYQIAPPNNDSAEWKDLLFWRLGRHHAADSARLTSWPIIDTIRIIKTVIRTERQHDTVTIKIPPDPKIIDGFKKILVEKDTEAAFKAAEFKTQVALVDYWRIRFWILVGIISVLIAAKFYFKI